MTKFTRPCPTCSVTLSYASSKNLWRANHLGVSCVACTKAMPRKPKQSQWSRVCPVCGIKLEYSSAAGVKKAQVKNTLCLSCTAASYPGHPQTEETKAKIKQNHKRPWLGKTNPHTNETKQKLREASINFITRAAGKCIPRYNPAACELFEQLNSEFGWSGRHAENGGEHHIKELGYFVDFYEPNLNLVIEYDEAAHARKAHRDERRESEIKQLLGCKFIRIKHTDDAQRIRQKIKEVV